MKVLAIPAHLGQGAIFAGGGGMRGALFSPAVWVEINETMFVVGAALLVAGSFVLMVFKKKSEPLEVLQHFPATASPVHGIQKLRLDSLLWLHPVDGRKLRFADGF